MRLRFSILLLVILSAFGSLHGQNQSFWDFAGTQISNSSYDPAATSLFNTIEGAGGTLTTTEKNATNTLIISGKAGQNWWGAGSGGVLNLVLGSTATTHSYNAFNPAAFQATYSGTVTHTSQHMVSNGTNGYANTGFNMNTHDGDGFATIAVWIRNSPADGTYVAIGATSGTNRVQIYPRLGDTFYGQVNTNNTITENTGNTTGGLFLATRTSSSSEYVQKNGSQFLIGASTLGIANNNIYVMAQNNGGTAAFFGAHQVAMYAIFPTPLTQAQATQFYTDISTFMTAMGR